MKCPSCENKELVSVMTQQGVEVDFCPQCEGIWLDKNEIYHFTQTPTYLKSKIEEAIKNQQPSSRPSFSSGKNMVELSILGGEINIDYCSKSGGIWLDKDEINKLPAIKTNIQIDKSTISRGSRIASKALLGLPNLYFCSTVAFVGLYALLTLFLIVLAQLTKISSLQALLVGIVVVIIQFFFAPALTDFTLKILFKVKWVTPDQLPQHLNQFISQICQTKKINFPRMGIILDGAPNAFTYGQHPNNARIVLTQGLLDLLDEKETQAVVGHELGHVLHWDMLIMTLVQLVPLVLYYIYRTLIRIKSSGKDKSAGPRILIAVLAYLLYIVSEFIVLWFSRIREFFADRFSGEVTGNPNSLASALVKIGYGLAGDDSRKMEAKQGDRQQALKSIGPLGIFDSRAANILAISSYVGPVKMGQDVDKDRIKDTAKWDLWNPWATYYELQSTHPLIAKRLKFLSNQSGALGKEPYIEFNENKPESYWDDFLIDLMIKILPVIVFILGVVSFLIKPDFFFLGLMIFIFGAAYLIQVILVYPDSDYAQMDVRSLLKKIKVSAIRPVPCVIKGKIIGRGIPGLIFSEDFVMQDETGIIFLDYRQPLGIFNFFFGLLRAAKYINQDVEIMGWYRRAPIPFIEIKKMKVVDKETTCFAYNTKFIFAILVSITGLVIAMRMLFK